MRETLQLPLGSACGKDIEMFAIAPLRMHHRKVSPRYYFIFPGASASASFSNKVGRCRKAPISVRLIRHLVR